jgi:hypothetical protein
MITGATINNGDIQLWENNIVQRTINGVFVSVATNGVHVYGLNKSGNVLVYDVKEKGKPTDTMKSFQPRLIRTVSVGRGAISISCGGGSESFQVQYDDGRTLVKNGSGSEMKGRTNAVLNEVSKNTKTNNPVLESGQSNPTSEVDEEVIQHFDSKLSEVWYILKKSCRTKQHWILTTLAAFFSVTTVYGVGSVSFAMWRGDNVWIALLATSITAIFMWLTHNLTAQIIKRSWYGLPAVILSLFIMDMVNATVGLVCVVMSIGLWCWPAWPFVALFFLALGKFAANFKGGDSHLFGTKMAGR